MKRYLSIALLVVLTACETVVDVDIPLTPPTIVMNALMNPDSVFTARIMQSKHVLESENGARYISDGTLLVVDSDTQEPIDRLIFASTGSRFGYRGTKKPWPGKRYSFVFDSQQFGSAQATETVPTPVTAHLVRIDSSGYTGQEREVTFEITFQDPPNEHNYYALSIYLEWFYAPPNQDTVYQRGLGQLRIKDASLGDDYYNSNQLLLADTFFDGKQHVLQVKSTSHLNPRSMLRAQLMLSHLSSSYYQYLVSSDLQQRTQGDPFAQPALVFTNIQNGLGILGASSTFVLAVKE
jgi:hypothetical protein